MTLIDLKKYSVEELVGAGIENHEAEAATFMLLEHILDLNRMDYLRSPDQSINSQLESCYLQAFSQLKEGKPLQHIIGETSFAGLRIQTGPDALIPRPETEELLELVHLEFGPRTKVLDVGTGTGILALGWKKIHLTSQVLGIDLSQEALVMAKNNARKNSLEVTFKELDFLDNNEREELSNFDLIVSNPPYIPFSESAEMESLVVEHEPHMALFVPDNDPLVFYKAIAEFADTHLLDGGGIGLEIHPPYAEGVIGCFSDTVYDINMVKDLSGKERFVIVRKK